MFRFLSIILFSIKLSPVGLPDIAGFQHDVSLRTMVRLEEPSEVENSGILHVASHSSFLVGKNNSLNIGEKISEDNNPPASLQF